jgi:hypothetical protein
MNLIKTWAGKSQPIVVSVWAYSCLDYKNFDFVCQGNLGRKM